MIIDDNIDLIKQKHTSEPDRLTITVGCFLILIFPSFLSPGKLVIHSIILTDSVLISLVR